MSLHPVHLVDSQGSLTPNALVPLCAYQSNLTLLGRQMPDVPFTVCDKFQPTVLEGQLCYSLDLGDIRQGETKAGLEQGLLLVIDGMNVVNNMETTSGDELAGDPARLSIPMTYIL